MNIPKSEKVYTFDLDGNLLYTDMPIVLEKEKPCWTRESLEVSVSDYDHNPKYKTKEYRNPDNNPEKAFVHARDFHQSKSHRWTQGFQEDIKNALEEGKVWSYFERYIQQVLIPAKMFSINTARGQVPDNIKMAIKKIIDNYLTPEQRQAMVNNIIIKYHLPSDWKHNRLIWWYLDKICAFLPISNEEVKKILRIPDTMSSAQAKTVAQDWYINFVSDIGEQYNLFDKNLPIKMWFSDDGYDNIKEMMKFFLSKQEENNYPYNKFNYRLYYTGHDIDMVEKNISQELINMLWSSHKVIVEQKKTWLITDIDEVIKEYSALKIML